MITYGDLPKYVQRVGGKPNPGTPKDMRLTSNRVKAGKAVKGKKA